MSHFAHNIYLSTLQIKTWWSSQGFLLLILGFAVNLAEGGFLLSRFHFTLCHYFLGHVI